MRKKIKYLILLLVVATLLIVSYWYQQDMFNMFRSVAEKNLLLGAIAFILLEILSVVVIPVATLFLTPVAVIFFGPFLTAIYSIIGWISGSIIAFYIARKFGKPFVAKYTDINKIQKYRKYISEETEFWSVVFMRILFPVDILSYALGLFSFISFKKYLIASIIGITPFAFIYSYSGNALLSADYSGFYFTVIIGLIIFLFTWIWFRRKK